MVFLHCMVISGGCFHSSHKERERGEPCRWETRPCLLLLLVIKLLWDELHSLGMDWK